MSNLGSDDISANLLVGPSWSEATLTYDSYAAGGYDAYPFAGFPNTVGASSTDVSEMVYYWLYFGVPNVGMSLTAVNGINATISTKESATAANRPTLTICYQ